MFQLHNLRMLLTGTVVIVDRVISGKGVFGSLGLFLRGLMLGISDSVP